MHIQLHNPKDITTGKSCNPIPKEKQGTTFSIVIQHTDLTVDLGIYIFIHQILATYRINLFMFWSKYVALCIQLQKTRAILSFET